MPDLVRKKLKEGELENQIRIAAFKFVSSFVVARAKEKDFIKQVDIEAYIENSTHYLKEEVGIFLTYAILLGSTFLYQTRNTPLHEGLIDTLNSILEENHQEIKELINELISDVDLLLKNLQQINV